MKPHDHDAGRPAVSVVIPAFEAAGWIADAIESAARPQLGAGDVELVVVDDGSSDGTADVAQAALEAAGMPFQLMRQANGGASAARNTGWHAACGEWIQFLDADDLLAPDKLSIQLPVARDQDARCGVVHSAWQRMAQDGDAWLRSGPIEDPVLGEPVSSIIEHEWFGYVGPCLIRRAALAAIGGFDEAKPHAEDLDLMLRIAINGWSFVRAAAPAPLFFYRQQPGSLWQRSVGNPVALAGWNQIILNAEEHLLRTGRPVPGQTRAALAGRYLAIYNFRDVDPALAEQLLERVLRQRVWRAPRQAPRSVRRVAPVLGLNLALRLHAAVRPPSMRRSSPAS